MTIFSVTQTSTVY